MKPHLVGAANGQYKHGMRNSPEYNSWAHMIQRCTNPKNSAWKNYGGRGITVCEQWVNDFQAFLKCVGEKPSPDLSIERIENDKGYEPGNVKWATKSEQSLNRRKYVHQKKKTHCPYGHAYDEKNTRVMKGGERRCRICINLAAVEWRKSHPNCVSNIAKSKRKNNEQSISGC